MKAGYAAAVLLVLALAAGISLRVLNHSNVTVRSPDEAIYTWQAANIADFEGDAMAALIKVYNEDKELWKLPPPTRIGYLWPLSYVMEFTGLRDFRAGAYVSLAFSILCLLFLAAFALKYFNPWIALYAVLMTGASAMDIAVSRRAWQDAVFGCLGFLLLYIASEALRDKGKALWKALFVILGSYCMLIKESGAVLYALCAAWLVFRMLSEGRRGETARLLIFTAVGAACSIGLLAFASGGTGNLIGVMEHIRDGMPVNRYAVEYQTGPWYNIPLAMFTISPLNAVFCLTGMAAFFAGARDKEIPADIASGVIFILLAFGSMAVIAPYCQNLRYISPVFALYYLAGGFGAWHVYRFIKSRFGGIVLKTSLFVMAAVVLCAAFSDYGYFRKAFISERALDISVRVLKERPRL